LMVGVGGRACHGVPPWIAFRLLNSVATRMFLNRSPDWTAGRCAIRRVLEFAVELRVTR
jgi:sporulation protein YlmC with PRC-barrel domain